MQPKPPINVKALIVRYLVNVILFATAYAVISYLLILANMTGFVAGIIAIAVSGFGMVYLMKTIGPWIDRLFEKNDQMRL